MGVIVGRSTMDGCKTPCCNECGIFLCWDISDDEYAKDKSFWDSWICQGCNDGIEFNRKHFSSLANV